jgi:hypothetical protein
MLKIQNLFNLDLKTPSTVQKQSETSELGGIRWEG